MNVCSLISRYSLGHLSVKGAVVAVPLPCRCRNLSAIDLKDTEENHLANPSAKVAQG